MEERRKRARQRNEARVEKAITERKYGTSREIAKENSATKEASSGSKGFSELRKSKSPSIVPPQVPNEYLNPVNPVLTVVRPQKLRQANIPPRRTEGVCNSSSCTRYSRRR
eukprot:TRINITY_DN5095_c0_g1_i1.p3 TRINITY_DN5095_c0_g1~~TRINITY_DN5095_c0_g1_i1.p3  ORF type:complete len:111 (-),score=8.53 TRINITY_DN5095_c0_g1_i1:178-510(-)